MPGQRQPIPANPQPPSRNLVKGGLKSLQPPLFLRLAKIYDIGMVATEEPPAYSPPSLDLTLVASPDGREVLVTVKAPPVTPTNAAGTDEKDIKALRAPVDFVLTIDVSGSMGTAAPAPGESEDTGLSVLDVVKHAAKTIIVTMKPEDRVAIVTFSNKAKEVYPLNYTTEEGKAAALNCIEGLHWEHNTNLWDGLKQSMNILTGAEDSPPAGSDTAASISITPPGTKRISSIFLLTDGMPNVTPPRGHLPMLRQYLESHPPEKTNFTINTFGFAYSLDSLLLHEIAKIGNGHFGFIPDAGMVGTTFVHAVANTYATYAEGLYIDIEVEDETVAKGMQVLGSFDSLDATWGVQVPMGVLQYGQSRDLVVKLPSSIAKAPLVVNARCQPLDSQMDAKTTRVLNEQLLLAAESATSLDLLYHTHRLTFVTSIHGLYNMQQIDANQWMAASRAQSMVTPDTEDEFNALAQNIRSSCSGHPDALALADDIQGQVLLAVQDSSAMAKWGRHYLLSLSRSHQRQQCGNFKDPGLMVYGKGSRIFKAWRDEIDKTFDDLPPPEPSRTSRPAVPQTHYQTSAQASSPKIYSFVSVLGGAPASPVRRKRNFKSQDLQETGGQPSASTVSSMQSYNLQHAPCFAGTSLVLLSDGSEIAVSGLSVGAAVKTTAGSGKVIGLIQTKVDPSKNLMCKFEGGLVITPWHPINVHGWRFPVDLVTPEFIRSCDTVYSIILEKNANSEAHAVFIGGLECVTLGHGVETVVDVRAHPFLSNHTAVMAALVGAPQNPTTGAKLCKGLRRDVATGLVTGFYWVGQAAITENAPALEVRGSLVLV